MKKVLMWVASIAGLAAMYFKSVLAKEKQDRAEEGEKRAKATLNKIVEANEALEEGLKNESTKSDSSKYKFGE